MFYTDEITLIADKTTIDSAGYPVTAEKCRDVFANAKSVTRAEYYEAMRSGISASIVFVVSSHDYRDERIVEYEGRRYKVERTYFTDADHVELTCSEVKLNNGSRGENS